MIVQSVVRVDDRLHRGNFWMPGKCGKARPDDRLADELAILLGQISLGAKASTGRHDDRCNSDCHAPHPTAN
jgi:hypothetical protein